jgi:hypothetical protein
MAASPHRGYIRVPRWGCGAYGLGRWPFGLNFVGHVGWPLHQRVSNKTRAQTRYCSGQVQVRPTGINLHPPPSGLKPTGHLKPEPELPSLAISVNFGT